MGGEDHALADGRAGPGDDQHPHRHRSGGDQKMLEQDRRALDRSTVQERHVVDLLAERLDHLQGSQVRDSDITERQGGCSLPGPGHCQPCDRRQGHDPNDSLNRPPQVAAEVAVQHGHSGDQAIRRDTYIGSPPRPLEPELAPEKDQRSDVLLGQCEANLADELGPSRCSLDREAPDGEGPVGRQPEGNDRGSQSPPGELDRPQRHLADQRGGSRRGVVDDVDGRPNHQRTRPETSNPSPTSQDGQRCRHQRHAGRCGHDGQTDQGAAAQPGQRRAGQASLH